MTLEELQKENNMLKAQLMQQEKSARLLVRRDLELSDANEKLNTLDKEKSEFVSIAAHQLRTPISAIKWALDMLLEGNFGELTEQQSAIVKRAFQSNEHMVFLVEDLLNVDRIESGQEKLSFAQMSICDVINGEIHEASLQALEKGVKIFFTAPERTCDPIMGNYEKLRLVFQNLINNAIKYTKHGGSVAIQIVKNPETVVVSIKDSGIGISEKGKARLFQKFFRDENAIRMATEGSGLGLYLAKQIIERHGGTITFQSVLNEGTTFTVTLPALVA